MKRSFWTMRSDIKNASDQDAVLKKIYREIQEEQELLRERYDCIKASFPAGEEEKLFYVQIDESLKWSALFAGYRSSVVALYNYVFDGTREYTQSVDKRMNNKGDWISYRYPVEKNHFAKLTYGQVSDIAVRLDRVEALLREGICLQKALGLEEDYEA